MRMAYLVAQKSHDPRTKIGSVLVRDKAVVATGYNSFPRRIKDSPERYADRELKLKIVAHSEANTILTSARFGIRTEGTTLYTFGHPCHGCSVSIIQGGVCEVVTHKQWPDLAWNPDWLKSFEIASSLLKEAQIPVRIFDKVLGITGLLNGKEISV